MINKNNNSWLQYEQDGNNGGYDSTREGAKEGFKGLPIYINPSHFHIKVTSFEILREILK
jgi:hypothetical protein